MESPSGMTRTPPLDSAAATSECATAPITASAAARTAPRTDLLLLCIGMLLPGGQRATGLARGMCLGGRTNARRQRRGSSDPGMRALTTLDSGDCQNVAE